MLLLDSQALLWLLDGNRRLGRNARARIMDDDQPCAVLLTADRALLDLGRRFIVDATL